MTKDIGRAPSGQALVVSDEARSDLHPSGFDPSRFKPDPMPGKLNSLQRDYIIAASGFYKGEPVPLSITNVPYQGKSSLNGLVTRGLMEERNNFYYLTENGWKVATAIQRLNERPWEVREIERHLERLAKSRDGK